MPSPEQVSAQDEARLALARQIEQHRARWADEYQFGLQLPMKQWDIVLAALRDPGAARGAEEWIYDMSAAPRGFGTSVLITVPSLHEDQPPFVGEAWYYPDEGPDEGWWWSGTGPGDYHASPIRETNAEPIAWRHLPEPAALPLPPAADEGGDGG